MTEHIEHGAFEHAAIMVGHRSHPATYEPGPTSATPRLANTPRQQPWRRRIPGAAAPTRTTLRRSILASALRAGQGAGSGTRLRRSLAARAWVPRFAGPAGPWCLAGPV